MLLKLGIPMVLCYVDHM